jgi:hypothetical protein
MKCEFCLSSLEEYFDGELSPQQAEEVAAHLLTCSSCTDELSSLQVTQDLISHYDREIEISPMLWQQVAERALKKPAQHRFNFLTPVLAFFTRPAFSFAAAALILLAVALSAVYLNRGTEKPQKQVAVGPSQPAETKTIDKSREQPKQEEFKIYSPERRKAVVAQQVQQPKHSKIEPSDVVSSDFGSPDLEDQDTAQHIEQTQNLLRSIRNVRVSESDEEIDVTYDKALSRRLLNENIVLRRDAEMRAKFPTKALLSDLEPILIDIANLPDQAKPEDVRVIKERVEKTEIVAELLSAGLR